METGALCFPQPAPPLPSPSAWEETQTRPPTPASLLQGRSA